MEEKIIIKEVIVRIYGSSTQAVKEAVIAASAIENVSCQLFGKDNEFVVNITVNCKGEAAAKSLLESAAGIIESRLGDDVYGRGAKTLAHKAASALIANEAQLCAATKELGEFLEEEFNTTSHGINIYDYGETTYKSKNADKIKVDEKVLQEHGADSIEAAGQLAMAARRLARVKYGAALSAPDSEGRRWIVVAEKKQTYVRQLPPNESMRAAALAVLDLVRRLSLKVEVLSPVSQPQVSVRTVNRKANRLALAAACITLVISIAAGTAAYYCYEKYYIPNMPDELAVQAFR